MSPDKASKKSERRSVLFVIVLEIELDHMSQVKSQPYSKEMKNPPSGLKDHEIFEHCLPPKNMTEDIYSRYPYQMYYPPPGLEEPYSTV